MYSTNLDLDQRGKSLLEKLNSLAKKYNIKMWDLGAACSSDSSAQVDSGEAKQMKGSQRSNITIRVWNESSLVGVTSTSDLTETGLEKAIEGAYNASRFGNKNEIPFFSPQSKSPLAKVRQPIKDALGIKKLLELLIEAESSLINSHGAIKTVPYNGISETNYQRLYINSDGAYRFMRRTQSALYLYARAQEDSRKPRSSGAIRYAYGANGLDIEGCIKEASDRTISHLNYKPIETGKYLVCFTPESFLELLNAFNSLFNARSILDGVSLSDKDSLGKKIAVPSLSIYDNGLHESNISASTFDGEGTPTRKICLVEEGILVNFLHSEATARKFGVEPTGHAGLGAKVSVGPDWFEVSNSNDEKTDISSPDHKTYEEKYVLVEGLNAIHSGVKASQGSFSLPFDGWLVNKGEKVSIEAATIAGDIIELFNNIVNVEKINVITPHGICPHIWVEGLSITGEA